MISFELFKNFPHLTGFTTTREGGYSVGKYASFNLSPYTGDNPQRYSRNKDKLCCAINISPDNLIIPHQNHGTEIRIIDSTFFCKNEDEKQEYLQGVDALITKKKNICIGITTADCVPILFFDVRHNIIAAAHAGWRGTRQRIAEKVIRTLQNRFNTDSKDLYIVIGPSICSSVYQVGEEVVTAFEDNKFPSSIFREENQKFYLDLWKANQWLLQQNGVPENQIEISGICTFTNHQKFFSARQFGIQSGRILSGIFLK